MAELDAVVQLPGVRPRSGHAFSFFRDGRLRTSASAVNGLVLSLPDRQQPIINDIVLRRGGYFTDRRDNEVIVNEAFAKLTAFCQGSGFTCSNNRREKNRSSWHGD